jgi:hypothetical protein
LGEPEKEQLLLAVAREDCGSLIPTFSSHIAGKEQPELLLNRRLLVWRSTLKGSH